jgi:hypothetical protein
VLRVLVPGAISPAKGLALLAECARDAAARSLPLHFHVIGYVAFPPPPLWPEVPLTVGGEYREGELARLLAAAGGDVIFFPVQVPETFSFTLSDALDTGLPIVATDLGSLPERLAAHPGARIVPWDTPAVAINDMLMALRTPSSGRPAPRVTFDDYGRRYLEGLQRSSATKPQAPVHVDPAWLEEPAAAAAPAPAALGFLFEDAFRCGRAH